MEIRPISTAPDALHKYQLLFERCFPTASHLKSRYLEWLYNDNPAGKVIGCDAWVDGRLAAHYACIPVDATVFGQSKKVMLSLNTATDPDFQGKGLFTKLADETYARGTDMGMAAVYGVANANSTPGFIRRLGFELIRPLDAKIGIGRLTTHGRDIADVEFRRSWDAPSLSWRIKNPVAKYRVSGLSGDAVGITGKTHIPGLRVRDEIISPSGQLPIMAKFSLPEGRLHLGILPESMGYRKTWFDLPNRFRSSPLNLIFRSLSSGAGCPAKDSISLGFLDFDAF